MRRVAGAPSVVALAGLVNWGELATAYPKSSCSGGSQARSQTVLGQVALVEREDHRLKRAVRCAVDPTRELVARVVAREAKVPHLDAAIASGRHEPVLDERREVRRRWNLKAFHERVAEDCDAVDICCVERCGLFPDQTE